MPKLDFRVGTGPFKFEEQLGYAAFLLRHSKLHGHLPLAWLNYGVESAIRHRQVLFVFDQHNKRVGYLSWATVQPELSRRLSTSAYVVLHESEWNEGRDLWVIDFVAPFGHGRQIIYQLSKTSNNYFGGAVTAFSRRTDADGRFAGVRRWRLSRI
jgi:cytolysin-activating lysine-acyltransferase